MKYIIIKFKELPQLFILDFDDVNSIFLEAKSFTILFVKNRIPEVEQILQEDITKLKVDFVHQVEEVIWK